MKKHGVYSPIIDDFLKSDFPCMAVVVPAEENPQSVYAAIRRHIAYAGLSKNIWASKRKSYIFIYKY